MATAPETQEDTTCSSYADSIEYCAVCDDEHPIEDGFNLGSCPCMSFRPCVMRYFEIVSRKKLYPIPCISCEEPLDPIKCLLELQGTPEVEALEMLILERELIKDLKYCANPRCSTPFDFEKTACGSLSVVCPLCKFESCVSCSTEWHEGKSCKEVQSSNALRKLASEEGWKSCPGCSHLIERVDGCSEMTCLCGVEFCYSCGKLCENKNGCGCRLCWKCLLSFLVGDD